MVVKVRSAPSVVCSGAKRGLQASGAKKTNMKVIVRVRPQNERERASNARCLVKTVDDKMLIFDPEDQSLPRVLGTKQKKQNKNMEFIYDRVFGPLATNRDVFEDSTREIIGHLLKGFNSSVFVYGATGAGKTFTMLGSNVNRGITYLTVLELYNQMERYAHDHTFIVRVSYLEVYNENVYDLLEPSVPLAIQENEVTGVQVPGLKHKIINNAEELLSLLARGNLNRTQHPTDANAESSRSHAVFQVYINMTNSQTKVLKRMKLSMIDLAGSERAALSGSRGARFKEGANINRSLLTLGNCINKLASGFKHIPFRDSKLTRLLKDSLGGNCHTVMIANVSPAPSSFEDTYNTLQYALRAKKIKSVVSANVISVHLHLAQYETKVANLQHELEITRQQLKEARDAAAAAVQNAVLAKRMENLQEWRDQLNECFLQKMEIHKEIMRLESQMKSVKYRDNVIKKTGERLSHYHPCDDAKRERAFGHIFVSLYQSQMQMKTFRQKIKDNFCKDIENGQRLEDVFKKIEDAGLTYELKNYITEHMHKLRNLEAAMELEHLRRLIVMQQGQLASQDNLIYAVLESANEVANPVKQDCDRILHHLLEVVRCSEAKKITNKTFVKTSVDAAPKTNVEALLPTESPLLNLPSEIADIMEFSFSELKSPRINNISENDASTIDMPYLAPCFLEKYSNRANYVRVMMELTTKNSENVNTKSKPLDYLDLEDTDSEDSETEDVVDHSVTTSLPIVLPGATEPFSTDNEPHEPAGTVENSILKLPRKRTTNEMVDDGSPDCKNPKYDKD